MRSDKETSWAHSFGEAALCILVLGACLFGCAVSCRSCMRDVRCQINGGDVVLKKWSWDNACSLDARDGGMKR